MQKIEIPAEKVNTKLPSAKEFYRETLINQRKVINEHIQKAIEDGKNEVKFSFETYATIDDEMRGLGWEYDTWSPEDDPDEEYTMYYVDSSSTEFDFEDQTDATTNEENGKVRLITAKEFYNKTLERQKQIIRTQVLETKPTGRNEVLLRFITYSCIDEEMRALGWEYGTWTPDDEPNVEYTMFYVEADDIDEEDY